MSAVAAYVHQREDEYFVGESRVTLRSVTTSWRRGMSPEAIQRSFPSLSLVAIYGAITYYLEHQATLDAHFDETDQLMAAHQAASEARHAAFFAEMRARLAARRAQGEADTPGALRP